MVQLLLAPSVAAIFLNEKVMTPELSTWSPIVQVWIVFLVNTKMACEDATIPVTFSGNENTSAPGELKFQ
jgi:hypothetical protein